MVLRLYDPEKDKEAVHRIWFETGWLEKDKEQIMDLFIQGTRPMVGEMDGEAECLVLCTPGTMRYLEQDLALTAVTGVTTSRVARKQGLARRLTALSIAQAVAEGAEVAGLGMFDQGFYNQLGFGNGGYEHWVNFNPARLNVKVRARVPRRITAKDWEMAHASRLSRMRRNGFCNLTPPQITQAEMQWTTNGFGLGYCDGPNGELTHHFWCRAKNVQDGPYSVTWMTYQNYDQFLELMALIKNLGDQVVLVEMCEPPGIQLQDLIEEPLRQRHMTRQSKFEIGTRAVAYSQVRICDVQKGLSKTHLRCEPVRLNLELSDPIARFLPDDAPWRGVAGKYQVTLGPRSQAEPGADPALPTLVASVGAFTRLWLGIRSATSLAVTDELHGPPALLETLDWALLLPQPRFDWDF